MKTHVRQLEESMNVVALHPSLESTISEHQLDPALLTVTVNTGRDPLSTRARQHILLADGTKSAVWHAPSLQSLFRDHSHSTPLPELPVAFSYMPIFFFIEEHVIHFCDEMGDRPDLEFEESYRGLRRYPDGESTSSLHAFLWQVAAVVLGKRPVTHIEFQALFERLALSAKNHRQGSSSRNYITTLRETNYLHSSAVLPEFPIARRVSAG